MPSSKWLHDPSEPIRPDPIDVAMVERDYGPLPATATLHEQAERYRLYQAAKLIRLYGPPGCNQQEPGGAPSSSGPSSSPSSRSSDG
jgi:hypothetical protein